MSVKTFRTSYLTLFIWINQEIEKVDDPKALNPLLLPWDIGNK